MLKFLNDNKYLILLCLAIAVGGLYFTNKIVEANVELDKYQIAYLHPKKYEKRVEHKTASFKIDKDIKVSVASGDFKLYPEGFDILNFKDLKLELIDKSKIDKKEDTTIIATSNPEIKPLMAQDKIFGLGAVINPLYLNEFGIAGSIKIFDTFQLAAIITQRDLFKEVKALAAILILFN